LTLSQALTNKIMSWFRLSFVGYEMSFVKRNTVTAGFKTNDEFRYTIRASLPKTVCRHSATKPVSFSVCRYSF
jgi:hypothetical protein